MIKKAGEKNLFIAEEAEKAIIEMVSQNASTVKISQCAIGLFSSKITSIKVKVVFTLNLVLEREKDSLARFKEINSVIRTLGKGIQEAA
jgi:hypothetical protein